MNSASIGIILIALFLAGCEVFHGPAIRNGTDVFIEIWVDYSNGHKIHEILSAKTELFERKKGLTPTHVIVIQEGKQFEFDENFFREFFSHIDDIDSSVIYFDGKTLNIVSISEARHRGQAKETRHLDY